MYWLCYWMIILGSMTAFSGGICADNGFGGGNCLPNSLMWLPVVKAYKLWVRVNEADPIIKPWCTSWSASQNSNCQ